MIFCWFFFSPCLVILFLSFRQTSLLSMISRDKLKVVLIWSFSLSNLLISWINVLLPGPCVFKSWKHFETHPGLRSSSLPIAVDFHGHTHTYRERDIKSFFLWFSLFSRLHCFLFNDIYHEHDYQSQTTGCQTTENRLKQNYSALLCFHFLKFPKCKSIEFIISNTIFHLCIQKKKVDTELSILNVQIQSRCLLSQAQHTYNSNKTVPCGNY